MRLNHLSLTNFRNYSRLELEMPRGRLVLLGNNAQGKTNLLESIYYLATSRSPYTRTDRQLINWLAEDEPLTFARLVAELETRTEIKRIEITLIKEPSGKNGMRLKKEIRINGVPRRTLDLLGHARVVLFTPQDMALVEGSPSIRRRYLDATLCQTDNAYCRALSEFDKVLSQRNALLRRLFESRASLSRADEQLQFWDERLANSAARVITGRNKFVRELERLAQPLHRELTGGMETLRLSYEPGFDAAEDTSGQRAFSPAALGAAALPDLKPEIVAERYRATLKANRAEEIRRGITLTGPQRDELRFVSNKRDLGHFGSRGQNRTAILALKLAEVAWMRDVTADWPILLLDEVAAELDEERRGFLLNQVNGAEQVVLTTTEPELLTEEFRSEADIWHVESGRITKDV